MVQINPVKKDPRFFDNIFDLVKYLENGRYIREATATKWEEGIKQALSYLESNDLMKTFTELYTVARGMQLILDRIKSDAFWKNQQIPEQLRKKLEALAESLRGFLSDLLDIIDYYADTNRSPPAIQASWSEKINRAYFQIKNGDVDKAIGDILIVIRDLQPLLSQISKIN